MAYESKITLTPRVADLDTQRHVTSRTYEHFCYEARLGLLAEHGLDLNRILNEHRHLRPVRSAIRFINQQHPGNPLTVHTHLSVRGNLLLWDHIVTGAEGKEACRITLETILDGDTSGPLVPDGGAAGERAVEFADIHPFPGTCKTIDSSFIMPYSDRDITGEFPPVAYWRVFEEGRWAMGDALGMTYERMRDMDTITFFMGGSMLFHKPPAAGQHVRLRTWIERIDKFRLYFRQDLLPADSEEVLASIREDQIIVSLAKARPKKPPREYLDVVIDILEVKPE